MPQTGRPVSLCSTPDRQSCARSSALASSTPTGHRLVSPLKSPSLSSWKADHAPRPVGSPRITPGNPTGITSTQPSPTATTPIQHSRRRQAIKEKPCQKTAKMTVCTYRRLPPVTTKSLPRTSATPHGLDGTTKPSRKRRVITETRINRPPCVASINCGLSFSLLQPRMSGNIGEWQRWC